MDFFYNPENWVAIATVLFVTLIIYLKVPALVAGALDKRAKEIADELEAARRLRDEAKSLLAAYQRRTAHVEKEVGEIVEHARTESLQLAREMQESMAAQSERRSKLVEEKIVQAQASAVQEVRTAAVDAAVSVARILIGQQLTPEKARALVEQSIADVRGKLH